MGLRCVAVLVYGLPRSGLRLAPSAGKEGPIRLAEAALPGPTFQTTIWSGRAVGGGAAEGRGVRRVVR
jgi:hypothetical protein